MKLTKKNTLITPEQQLFASEFEISIIINMQQLISSRPATYKSFVSICIMTFNISLSSFYFGYTFIYFAAVPIDTIRQIYHINYDGAFAEGLLNGALSIGALMGSLLSSILLECTSRRNCLLLTNLCSILIGVLIYIPNFYSFLVFRAAQGICVGVFSSISPLIIKEISPLQLSGITGNFSHFNLSIGVLFGQILSYVLKKATGDESGEQFWFIIFGFTFLTQLLQMLLLTLVYPYETPKYLLLKGCNDECRELLNVIYKQKYVEEVLTQKLMDISHHGQNNMQEGSFSSVPAMVAGVLTTLQQFTGIGAIVLYASDIAKQSFSGEIVLLIPMLVNLVVLIFICVSFVLLHNFGRKTIIVTGFIIGTFSCGIISYGYSSSQQSVILAGILLFTMNYGASLGPVVWLYIPEVVSPSTIAYITACNWMANTFVVMIFPIVTQDLFDGNPAFLFLSFSICCLVGAIFCFKMMVQTQHKTQKEIREEYQAIKAY